MSPFLVSAGGCSVLYWGTRHTLDEEKRSGKGGQSVCDPKAHLSVHLRGRVR